MNTKHTPGPWMESSFEVWSPLNGKRFGKVVADLRRADGTSDEAKANARLIAAAPELLDELRKCRNVIAHCISELPQAYKEAARTQMNKAGEAIAKATNETL